MRIWLDTEFIDNGRTIDLISIGLVREDGAEYYAESADCNLGNASSWVRANVIPHLRGPKTGRGKMAAEIREFVGHEPEFWAYFAAYDWVALCQLYGPMMSKPDGWPFFCLDIKQIAYLAGNPSLQRPDGGDHHALADARWNRDIWRHLRGERR